MDSVVPQTSRKSVLFVCMGNICRSPILMAILQKLAAERGIADQLRIDSCALTGWFIGQPIDPRMREASAGMELQLDHCARALTEEDFASFDIILAVDREVLSHLQVLAAKREYKGKLCLATTYSRLFADQDIKDPYYSGTEGFKKTIEIAIDCCEGLLGHVSS